MEREERIQDEGENENGGQSSQQRQPVHTRFQNTLADGSVYAVGVATDQPLPMWDEALEILPPDVVDGSSWPVLLQDLIERSLYTKVEMVRDKS